VPSVAASSASAVVVTVVDVVEGAVVAVAADALTAWLSSSVAAGVTDVNRTVQSPGPGNVTVPVYRPCSTPAESCTGAVAAPGFSATAVTVASGAPWPSTM
jgi:hypothetical protein